MNSSLNRRASEAANNRLRAQVRAFFWPRKRVQPPVSLPRISVQYQLLKEIGNNGARATVYLARDERHGRWVAVKMLADFADAQSRRRLRREAVLASSLNHPNIVAIYKILRTRELEAIVMEYVPGKPLDRLIPKRGLLLSTCLVYALQIAQALAAVHSAGMIHRDLKPRNFIVTNDGIVKLLDFGLAKAVGQLRSHRSRRSPRIPETRDGTILGTIGYMSPEQVLGKSADHPSDIFSFGAILHEMLTGQRAFREDTDIATMSAILQKPPPILPARIPTRIVQIVRRCLAKEPHRRYRTGMELVAELERVINEESDSR